MRVEGKVAFVSGGARGLGAADVRLLSQEGASVAFGDVLEDEGRRLESELREQGRRVMFVPLDVTDEAQWLRAVAATVAEFGGLDVMVNNAAVGGAGPIEETTVEGWNRVMAVNVTGVFLGTKTAIPEMRRRGGGSIINISSQMGMVGSEMSNVAYQTSKGAVRMFTKAAAIHHAKDGIRVNSVHPGPILTRQMELALAENRRQEGYYVDRVPLGRLGRPLDVAYCVLYLASDESAFVTGSEQVVDGGWTAQ